MNVVAIKESLWNLCHPNRVNISKFVDLFFKYAPRLSLASRFDRHVNCAWGAAVLVLAIYGVYKKVISKSSPVVGSESLAVDLFSSEVLLRDPQESAVSLQSPTFEATFEAGQDGLNSESLTVWINASASGPIGNDRKFNFRERIKTESGDPIVILENDFYVVLEFKSNSDEGKKNYLRDTNALPMTMNFLYLPSNLFEGKKEGEAVRFLYENVPMELILNQDSFKKRKGRFENVLEEVKAQNLAYQRQSCFDEDLLYPRFFRSALGFQNSLCKLDSPSDVRAVESTGLDFYRKDSESERCYGSYRCMNSMVRKNGNTTIYTFDLKFKKEHDVPQDLDEETKRILTQGVEDHDVHLLRSRGYNDLDQLWILVPHKRKEQDNVVPRNHQVVTGLDDKEFHGVARAHKQVNPKGPDHLFWYHYGQYGMISILKGYTYKIEKTQPLEDGYQMLRVTLHPEEQAGSL